MRSNPGFRVLILFVVLAVAMPVRSSMFHRLSVAMCSTRDAGSGGDISSAAVARLVRPFASVPPVSKRDARS